NPRIGICRCLFSLPTLPLFATHPTSLSYLNPALSSLKAMRLVPSLRLTLLASTALLAATSLQAQRLPTNAHPQHYSLALTPDLKVATFTGTESIDLTLDS